MILTVLLFKIMIQFKSLSGACCHPDVFTQSKAAVSYISLSVSLIIAERGFQRTDY